MEALRDVRNTITIRNFNNTVVNLPGEKALRYISVGHMTLSKKKLHSKHMNRSSSTESKSQYV